MAEIHALRNEVSMSRREAQESKKDLETCRAEKSSLQRVLDNTLDEKKEMTDKINTLTAIGENSKIGALTYPALYSFLKILQQKFSKYFITKRCNH